MALVCSNCEAAPVAGATSGSACAACGERLILVDAGDDLVGVTLDGRFEVIAPLGRGGMGVVYRAKQHSIGREIAIKVLDRRIEKDLDSVKRFFREAKLAATLQHPNTVAIIDSGQHTDGRLYLAMELIKGRTLHEEINARGAFALPRLATIGIQLCDALEAAHDLQIVHRDLKLENVMLVDGKRDHVKILDFGLARSLVDRSTALTATDLVSGTPRYMPPEVGMDAAPPAPAQDLYSVGVMLAEMAIGSPLWSAPTLEMLFMKKLETEQSIAAVPAKLKPLVRALLANDPAARPTASQARELLRGLETGSLADPAPNKFARARSPIALEPTAEIQVVVDTTATPDPFAALDGAATVALDELPQPPPSPRQDLPAAPGAKVVDDHDPRFAMPAESDIPATKLEIDRAYVAERSAKLAARRAPPVVKKKSKAPKVLALLLVLGGLGGGAYYYWFHYRTPKVEKRLEGPGITITIEADGDREIFVDGKPAGTTPARLQVPKGTKPITITGNGLVGKQVVPDRDQTIELDRVK